MVFGLFKKLQKKAEKPAQTVTAVQPAQDSLMPDTPIPFGYKTGWLCIRCDDPDRAMDVLHGTNRRVCNWSVGLAKAGENGTVFVSPVLDGYVLVVGILEPQPEQLECWAAEFPELQYFGTHRVVECHSWARYQNGNLLRGYTFLGEAGEVTWEEGKPTPEELALGAERFPKAGEEIEWDSAEFPDEETVLSLAAAWGMDTRFDDVVYPAGLGWLCVLP